MQDVTVNNLKFTLHHHPICPLSRQVRVLLEEFQLDYQLIKQDYWLRQAELVSLNPNGNLPIMEIDKFTPILVGNYCIIEYLTVKLTNFFLMPISLNEQIEVRKNISWFNDKFYREVSKILIDEKMIRLLMRAGEPRTNFIRAAKANLHQHFKLLSQELEKKSYIALDQISCADIAAAAHISVIDYFGEINWDIWPNIKEWYLIIKSRPAWQKLLKDQIAGFPPPAHYRELDF